jgi:AraC family transcriptional regulator of adaptative response / DNA-3-methyladenine glycosylase II
LTRRFGDAADTPFAGITHHFPMPEKLAAANANDIAQIGVPAKRAETIRHLAGFAARDELKFKPGTSLPEVIAHLRSVEGIGEWTAQYIAMRALRFTDAFPAGDLGLQKAAGELGGGPRMAERQLIATAGNWSPWRAYAAQLLWHALVKQH